MNVLFVLLISVAITTGLVTLGLLFIWLKGADSLVFPGAGFVITTPAAIILLNLIQLLIVVVAMLVGRYKAGLNRLL